ncbi:MAG: AsmA family protein [Deltaproteobacteria bacterium]|nr:AsmA family protein [Deltaproteobacteria bacterium]
MHKRIILAVALILAAVMVLALLNVNFFVGRNRDYLVSRAEQALGRKISIDRMEVTLWPFGVRLKNFALAGDPAFSAEDFLRAKDLRVELRLLPLFIGQFRPRRIALESPRITILRDATGSYNFEGAARNEKNNLGRAGSMENGSSVKQESPLLLLSIPSLNISDGTLHYRDLRSGGDLVVSRIDMQVSDFKQDQPFEIQLEAAIMAAEPNLRLKSRIGPMAGDGDYRDVPLDGEINADSLDLGKVNKALPRFRKALPKALRFDGIYTIKELKFKGTLNNLSLKGAVSGTDASFRFE